MASFAQARDFLLAHRTDYATAYAGFEWPNPDEFNFAIDWPKASRASARLCALWALVRQMSVSPNSPPAPTRWPTGCAISASSAAIVSC